MSSENKKEKTTSSATALVQIKSTSGQLSKEQQAFNRLTKRIDDLQRNITASTERLNSFNIIYQRDVFSKVLELGRSKIKLSHLLHKKRDLVKLSKAQNNKLDKVIFDLLDDAFSVITPDEETKNIFDSYSDSSFDDEMSLQEEEISEMMADMFFKNFGLKLDPSMLKGNPDFGKIENDLRQQFEQKKVGKKAKKKTKKQLEKEALEEQKEALKKKSLRSIYLSLVKILHPDIERDEILKKEKEETMKKVTSAYESNDMAQLLQIEMQWVKTHEDMLAGIDTNTVNVYVQLLKDQVKQLEQELEMIYMNPAFSQVSGYRFATDKQAKDDMKKCSMGYDQTNMEIATDILNLEASTHPSGVIKQCIQHHYIKEEENDFFF